MSLIIGIILILGGIAWGGYPYFVEDFSYSLQYYAQLSVAILGGAYLVFYENFWTVSNWFMKMMDSKPSPVIPNIVDGKDYSLEDYEALVYLKNRAKQLKSEKAEKLVIELNNLIFAASMGVENE